MEAVGVCPDCLKWSRKYSKIDAGRNVLRQTVAILEKRLDEFTQLNSTLKKEVEELRSQADIEQAARNKEYETRAALEKEIADLKAELLKLQKCTQKQSLDTDQQVTRVSELENEIQKLNKLLDEEKSRVDAALKNVQAEKTKATKAQEAAKLEKNRAGKEKSRAAAEAKKAQEYKTQLDALKNEAAQTRSQLTLAASKSEESNSRLEAERRKTSEEQQRAHLMNTEAEKLKSLVGTYEKKLAYEKHHADILTGQLDEERKKNEEMLKTMDVLQEKIKSLEASSKYSLMRSNTPDDKGADAGNLTTHVKIRNAKASRKRRNADAEVAEVLEQTLIQSDTNKKVEERRKGDKLTHALQGVSETVKISAHVNQVIAHTHDESIDDTQPEKITCVPPRESSCDGKEQIKIANKQAKKIVKKFRKSRLKKELDILKQDVLQFSNTLEYLDCTLSGEGKGASVSVEGQNCSCLRWKEQKLLDVKRLQLERERENPLCALHMPSNITFHHSEQALCPPDSGINIAESTSITETNAKLELPAYGSYKDLYVSSAKNSSGASYSDCWSMHSHGKFDSSTTSSNLADGSSLQMTDSRLCGDVTELMHSVVPAIVSKSGSLGNAIPGGGPFHCKKRKRILSLLESVQYGLSDSRKIQMQMEENISILRIELQNQMARPAEIHSVAWNNQYDMFDNSCKKKEVLHRRKVSSQGLHVELDNGSPELDGVTADVGIGSLAIVPANNLLNGANGCKSTNVASSNENSQNPSEFVAQIDGDYMVLLDLDDHCDERRYRVARENLLSSSLPEINYHGCNVYSVDGADHTIMDSSNVGLCSPNCIPHVDHVGDSLKEHDTLPACAPMVQGDAANCFSVKDIRHGSRDLQVEGSSFEVIVSKETRPPCETLYSDDISNLCVVHSETIDRANLCKVFDATRKGASQCNLSSPPGVLLKRVLDYIESNDVPPEQKACVCFSMILAGSHGSAARELSHPIRESDIIPNSYIADIFSAINNVDIRNCLAQTLSLHELLNFIAEFIMERKLWVCRTPDRNLIESDDPSESVLVGNMKLSLEAASTEQLVVASTILASLCVSFDEFDFIVLLTYNLFRLRKYDYKVALSVIHVFAQLSGREFLTSTSNSLLADVVNSLISVLESSQSPSKLFFSEEVSLNTAIILLLERLQSLMEMAKTKIPYDDSQEEISNLGVPDIRSSSSLEEIFAQFTDVLSLLELIANTVSWDILSDKVVPQLLMKLKSSTINIFSAAIITVLGQFGRLGVAANGPEDTWVVRIRCQLTGMMGVDSNRNLMHPVQVACACSLLKFVNLDPDSLLCNAGKEAPVDKASPACEIRSWFTSLSEEHQTIFMGILKEAPPV